MNLRMPLDHFPDTNLGDIEEEDEECELRSEESGEDFSREALVSQDGLTSDDTDLEPFSKSTFPRSLLSDSSTLTRLYKIKLCCHWLILLTNH